ncbi:MAG: hypothetical protein NZ903_01255 [Candidatus Micrarchaeota archaeon]|nr:hypothetical protein [Candidatus Micrarchaeota archaeon]
MVFIGESEESFPQFLMALQENREISDVNGLYIKDENGHAHTGKAKQVNLDDFPPSSVKYKNFGQIEITRGCPFCCFYCQKPQLFGAKIRYRSEDVILE